MIELGRDICNQADATLSREWLVTNGIGGYAAGTVAGALTRSYHGLLVAALGPPLGRTLLLAKLDESVHYDGETYPLFANQWNPETIEPLGCFAQAWSVAAVLRGWQITETHEGE